MDYKALCTVSFENLDVGDTVFLGTTKVFQTAPFDPITDTINFAVNPKGFKNNHYPHYGEKMNSYIRWEIRNNVLLKAARENVYVDPCETLIHLDNITISK